MRPSSPANPALRETLQKQRQGPMTLVRAGSSGPNNVARSSNSWTWPYRRGILRVPILWAILIVGSTCPACRSPYYADRGAAVGAVTGALAGAAIGENNGNAGAGAAIGTAVGALTGAAIGDGIDQDIARSEAATQQWLTSQFAGGVTVSDVISMTHAGLSTEVITTHILTNGVAQRPQVGDLIALRDAGVSDASIQALQQANLAQASPPPPSSPVIVEEHHYLAPTYPPYWRWHSHRPWPRHRRPGFSWGFSVSH
jgi:hypothetical protein